MAGHYFLEGIEEGGGRDGYVCLLREVGTLGEDVTELLKNGLSKEAYMELTDDVRNKLSFDAEDFGMPVSQIGSPTVEHILQTFAYLYSRIGVEEVAKADAERFKSLHTGKE